ncbi:uncharacterized protein [Aegilops tauschii subsp. strangulata]|uniref:uncharacterized protein n=1 Tax=Aegilops tauschii subsp. strangulata TaxID=200361 RepID=UPI003CC849CF
MLKHLAVRFHALGDLGVSVLPPMVEKVSWRRSYARAFYRLGLWGKHHRERSTCPVPAHVGPELRFPSEMHKHLVTNFSGLDLHLRTKGHVFGAFVLRLLAMHPIHTASIRNLKVILLRSEVTTTACQLSCLCHDPNKDWRTQNVWLADLESMAIEGIDGEDHELDFLNLILTCAPVLKRVTLRFADGVTPCVDWCTKINNIFMSYPCVEQGRIQWVFHE